MKEIVNDTRSDRRRDWGLFMLAGGGMAMTTYASVALWMLYDREAPPSYLFYMGLSALALIGIVLTGFSALLVKRTFRIGKDGVEYSDQHHDRPLPQPEFGDKP